MSKTAGRSKQNRDVCLSPSFRRRLSTRTMKTNFHRPKNQIDKSQGQICHPGNPGDGCYDAVITARNLRKLFPGLLHQDSYIRFFEQAAPSAHTCNNPLFWPRLLARLRLRAYVMFCFKSFFKKQCEVNIVKVK